MKKSEFKTIAEALAKQCAYKEERIGAEAATREALNGFADEQEFWGCAFEKNAWVYICKLEEQFQTDLLTAQRRLMGVAQIKALYNMYEASKDKG